MAACRPLLATGLSKRACLQGRPGKAASSGAQLLRSCVAAQETSALTVMAPALELPIKQPRYLETTALGISYLAGLDAGT